ncbi:MAG: hypothetical protein IKB60_03290 [Clostridia bacterium]|nr:hypothetical protein [Clostridia bacterium]
MKKSMKEFKQYVRFTRRMLPCYNKGRNVVVLSEYTEKGKQILARGSRYEGTELYQVYYRPSYEKQKAYEEVWEMFCNDVNGECFSICSHNHRVFTVSWLNKDGLIYLTNKTEYLVLINE